jgi:ribosome-associated protein
MSPDQLAVRIASIADEKQAADIVALRVSELIGYTDVVVICTARNERMAKAIHDEVYERLKHEDDLRPGRTEGVGENRWILLDYLDCILHIFVPETRERYRLEQLWGEAESLELGLEAAADTVRHPA